MNSSRITRAASRIFAAILFTAAPVVAAGQQSAPADSGARQSAPAQPPLRRLTLGERTPAYDWKAGSAAFRQAIPVFPADSVDTVRVVVSTLRGPAGREVAVTAYFGADTMRKTAMSTPLAPAMLRLAATLPEPGEYHGTFALVARGQRTTGEYKVTWTRHDTTPAGLEVRGTGAVAATVGTIGGEVTIPLTVVDSGGSPAVVRLPELESFARNAVADTSVQVDFGEVRVLGADGKHLTGPFTLQPDESRRLRLRVSGIRGPGRYTGSVRVAGEGVPPVLTNVTVYVRRSGWLALFLILAGVLISGVIRHYQQKVRPMLLRQRRAAELLDWLSALERQLASTAGGVTSEERDVMSKLSMDLQRVYDSAGDPVPAGDAGAAAAADATARLALAAARLELLPDWVNARRQVDAVSDAGLRDDLRAKLAPVREALRSGTAEEVKKAGETVRSIPAEIAKGLRERLEAEIDAFGAKVKEARAASSTADVFLKSLESEVQRRLARAKTAAGVDHLAEATAEFDRARLAYADLVAKELRLRLGDAVPGWMDPAEWARTKREVEEALALLQYVRDPEERIETFNGALSLYLRSMAAALGAEARETLGSRPGLSDDQKVSLALVAEQGDAVLARAAAGDTHGAAAAFAAAEKAYRDLLPTLPKPSVGVQMHGGTSVAAPPPLGATAAVGAVPGAMGSGSATLVAPPPIRRMSARAISEAIRWNDLGVSVLVGLIAIALGMSLLWAGKLTWGSVGDLFTAFLWGLGLHQAGTATGPGGTTGLLGQLLGKERDAAA